MKLKTLPQILRQNTLNAVRRGTRAVRNEIHAEYVKRGIGRALFTGKGSRILGGSALQTIIKVSRTKYAKDGDLIETGVYLKGTAAMVQQGLKTKDHDISPSRMKFIAQRTAGATSIDAKKAMWRRIEYQRSIGSSSFGLKGALSNQARGGGFFSAGTVHHPGSQFKKDDFMGRGMARGAVKFRDEVAKGVAQAAAFVNNG